MIYVLPALAGIMLTPAVPAGMLGAYGFVIAMLLIAVALFDLVLERDEMRAARARAEL